MNVKERANAVGTYRHANVFLMETLARWVPSTPEMEAKILFGRHLWLLAQMADRLGRRARELRAPLNHTRPPAPATERALEGLAGLRGSAARVEGFYRAALDQLSREYEAYLADTDPILDEPTVVILQDALREIARMRADLAGLVAEFPALAHAAPEVDEVLRAFAGAGSMVREGEASQRPVVA